MAGPVRQPIDLGSLERYIDGNAPQIKTPLSLKQVCSQERPSTVRAPDTYGGISLVLVNRILHIRSRTQREANM